MPAEKRPDATMPVMSANGDLTFRWLANILMGLVGAIGLTLLGWLSTSMKDQDARISKTEARVTTVEVAQQYQSQNLQALQGQVDQGKRDLGLMVEQQAKDQQQIQALQRLIDIHQDWIDAHAHADKAIRELR